MMRFKEWMAQEGWRMGDIPDNIKAKLGQDKTAKQDIKDDIYKSQLFKFDPKDADEDFIKVNVLNTAKELPIFSPPESQLLQSFEGATIHYGLEFNTKKAILKQILEPMDQQIKEKATEIKMHERKLEIANMRRGGISKDQAKVIKDEFDNYEASGHIIKTVGKYGGGWSDSDYYPPDTDGFKTYFPDVINEKLKEVQLRKLANAKILGYIEAMKEEEKTGTVDSHRKNVQKAIDEINNLRSEYHNQRNIMTQSVQEAFIKKIKHPETQEDLKLQEHFIKLTADIYTKSKGTVHYDYVVYPESGSKFNEKLASVLALHYNARPVKGLSKIPQPTMDTTGLYFKNFANKEERELYPRLRKPDPGEKKGAELERLKKVAGIKDQSADSDVWQQKNVRFGPLRHFIKNLKLTPGLRQVDARGLGVGFKGRNILFIDDNVASGSTIQRGHHILKKIGPRKIDIYVPIKYAAYKSRTAIPHKRKTSESRPPQRDFRAGPDVVFRKNINFLTQGSTQKQVTEELFGVDHSEAAYKWVRRLHHDGLKQTNKRSEEALNKLATHYGLSSYEDLWNPEMQQQLAAIRIGITAPPEVNITTS